MDMSIARMSMDSALASLQSAASMLVLDKTLNQGASEMATMLSDFKRINPPSNHKLDVYA